MELHKINLTNFRSIKNCSVTISKIKALVGENNSGKSALLRALNAFFNYEDEKDEFILGHHQYTANSLPRIELCFNNIEDRKKFKEFLNGEEIIIRLTYSPKTHKRTIHCKKNRKYILIENSIIDLIKTQINYVFIPPNRDPSKIKWAEETLLKELVEAYLLQATNSRDNLTPRFLDAAHFVERNAFKKISNLTKEFYSLGQHIDYKIKFEDGLSYKNFISNIQFLICEKDAVYELSDCGSGIQSLTIIALHRALSNLKHKKIILGLEEPETNLHPQAQRELIHSIKDGLNQNDKSLTSIILTTHSPVLVDQIGHDQIVLFRKIDDEKRGFRTEVNSVPQNFFADHGLDEFKYYQFHHYRNSDFFYSKFIIIVESKNDAEVIRYFADSGGYDLDYYGISIINLEGVPNLKYPLYIVNTLKIPHLIILDKDYFIPYANDDLSDSRNNSGFPKYRYEYKKDILLESLISSKTDQKTLLKLFKKNHSRALDLLEKHHIICMKFSLEIDLIVSTKASELFYNRLNIGEGKRTTSELLVERPKQIKRIEHILHVIKILPHKNLPNSYKRIKKILFKTLKQLDT